MFCKGNGDNVCPLLNQVNKENMCNLPLVSCNAFSGFHTSLRAMKSCRLLVMEYVMLKLKYVMLKLKCISLHI